MNRNIKIAIFVVLLIAMFYWIFGGTEITTINTLSGRLELTEKVEPQSDEIKYAEIYFDASGSMKGYVLGDNGKFNGSIAKLFNFTSEHDFYTIGSAGNPVKVDFDVHDLNRHLNEFTGGDTRFDRIIPQLCEKSGNGKVCFLVTDGIIYINQNTSIALEAFQHTLTESIRGFNNKAFAVYQMSSPFRSTGIGNNDICYYDMNNTHIALNCNNRPFYIIAVGDVKDIRYLKSKTEEIIEPENQIYFGIHNIDKHTSGSQIETDVVVNPNLPLELTLTLPECLTYLYNAEKEFFEGENLVLILDDGENLKPWTKGKDYEVITSKNRNVVNITVDTTDNIKTDGKLIMSVNNALPKLWSDSLSIDNDTSITETPRKTFGLKYLLLGLKNAVEKNDTLIKVTYQYKL